MCVVNDCPKGAQRAIILEFVFDHFYRSSYPEAEAKD
ncbi:unnamed protein product, partial [marine sediment metagenome]